MNKKMPRMQQRTLDFERPSADEPKHVAVSTSLPPPAKETKSSPLVRPDRQIVYEDAPNHYDWPDATLLHDHDTITVDRIVDDIDGPAHRFVIKRGDTVEAHLAHEKFHVGEVIGISHARQEVRVAWDNSLEKGGWALTSCVGQSDFSVTAVPKVMNETRLELPIKRLSSTICLSAERKASKSVMSLPSGPLTIVVFITMLPETSTRKMKLTGRSRSSAAKAAQKTVQSKSSNAKIALNHL